MKNYYLNFYGKHDISPVKQDISDYMLHLTRRRKLYRQLGIPLLAFQNARMLEVGSGGGYNTIAFFEWGAHVDIVEANNKGIEDMLSLFQSRAISEDQYEIFHTMIETYESNENYDIIIAEGFLPCVENKVEIIEKLKSLLNKNGILVVTCMDEVGMYIEQMKRLVGHILIRDVKDYEEQVNTLAHIFEPQLKKLNGVSRSAKDWVQDQILCSAINIKELFSLEDALHLFDSSYEMLGSSPQMFTDYSWYKDVNYDVKEDYLKQYSMKNHNLLIAGTPETILSSEVNHELKELLTDIRNEAILYEKEYDWSYVEAIHNKLSKILELAKANNLEIATFTEELLDILSKIKSDTLDLSKYEAFFALFGRGQQYISFAKIEE